MFRIHSDDETVSTKGKHRRGDDLNIFATSGDSAEFEIGVINANQMIYLTVTQLNENKEFVYRDSSRNMRLRWFITEVAMNRLDGADCIIIIEWLPDPSDHLWMRSRQMLAVDNATHTDATMILAIALQSLKDVEEKTGIFIKRSAITRDWISAWRAEQLNWFIHWM